MPPDDLTPEALANHVEQTRDMIIKHLSTISSREFARALRGSADNEVDPDRA
jgi:hypothetical protein